jgi:TldD protein
MPSNRREFLKKTSAAAVAVTLTGSGLLVAAPRNPVRWAEPAPEDLMMEALDAAKAAGATYADVRIGRYRRQSVSTRERRISGISDSESYGLGIRTIVGGAWGFASTSVMTTDGVVKAAREAARLSRAARTVQKRPVELSRVEPVQGPWQTPIARDPLEVPLADKVALLFATNEAALGVKGVRFAQSSLQLLREIKMLATTEGTNITQTFVRVGPNFSATALGEGDFQSYSHELAPRSLGWEYIESLAMPAHAAEWAQIAVEKLGAKSVEPGRYDLILDPTNLWLTIHESIGHPTELDRALGYEADYAGTSFVAPPEAMIGKLKYGTPIMNVEGNRTEEGSASLCKWDDEGVPADRWLIIEKGIFKDYQTTREQAAWISQLTGNAKSHGCSFAQSWDAVQFQRMPNVSLLPAEQDVSLNDIVGATDRGVLIKNRGSWSIDHQRYNFQFSGQVFYEIRGGKITGMLRDVAYQSNTPQFWNAMDMIGGKSTYWLGGTFGDGKGQPGQSNSTGHGCPVARFRGVNIINTGRNA